MEKKEFDYYSHLLLIIKDLEETDDYDDNIILKRLIYLTSCELSSCFLDNIFVISKVKFANFENNKKFSKAMLDMLYQILKVFNAFQYKSVVNLFETLSLGGFGTDSMIFFFKVLLTFYFTHEITMIKLSQDYLINDYELMFKKKFNKGFEKMKGIIRTIPLLVLLDTKDEEYISVMLRIECDDNKRTNSMLPPVKQKNNNNLYQSELFTTSIVKGSMDMSGENSKLNIDNV